MKKIYLLLFFTIISSCSSIILKDISYEPSLNSEKFNDVFIVVNIWGVDSKNKYYQELINKLTFEFKKRGIDSSGFIYDKHMVNGDEILRQKINIFNPKYIMEFQSGISLFVSIKEVDNGNEMWKAFLGKAFISSDTYSQAIIQELEKQKILK